jgi:Kef-type K+ transport system membrane component KefB
VIPATELSRVLISLLALLLAAHAGGAVFARIRQPRVIGEILGGLVLGPTVLGQIWPGAVQWMFLDDPTARAVIGTVQQFGLFLLMFCAGVDARRRMRRSERRVIAIVSVTGLVLPFTAGALAVTVINTHGLWGDNANRTSFTLVFATAIAVTSIPVISRIMHDLGILQTGFARVVLGVAVIEDVILYVVLAVAIDVSDQRGKAAGLPAALGLNAGSAVDIVYHAGMTVALLALLFGLAPVANRWIGTHPGIKGPVSSTTRRLLVLLTCVVMFMLLDLEAFLGAFAAGVFVGTPRPVGAAAPEIGEAEDPASRAQDAIRRFGFAFFIPCYFALVGVNVDLAHGFEVYAFLGFLTSACAVKASAIYLGGRLAGLRHRSTLHLAVALNARGGPGIVLATVAFAAGIINEEFYIWLILLAILTSIAAGAYLQRVPKASLEGSPNPQQKVATPEVVAVPSREVGS